MPEILLSVKELRVGAYVRPSREQNDENNAQERTRTASQPTDTGKKSIRLYRSKQNMKLDGEIEILYI